MTSPNIQPTRIYDLPSHLKTPINQEIPTPILTQILSNPPFLPIPNALNLRSIPLPSTTKIQFYRSGPIHYLSPSDQLLLLTQYNITKIYDLRSRHERQKIPSAIVDGIETLWTPCAVDAGLEDPQTNFIPVEKFLEGKEDEKGKETWLQIYQRILRTHGSKYKAVFETVRYWKESDGRGVLFHCTAGKDRTGLLSALLLAIVSSPPATISYDYALSRIGTEPYREMLLTQLLAYLKIDKDESVRTPGMLEMAGTHAWVAVRFLEWMNIEYGDRKVDEEEVPVSVHDDKKRRWPGVEGWLVKVLGFSAEDVAVVRRNLGSE